MGMYLSSPNTKKDTILKENQRFKVAASDMQGWRINMEDAHIVELDLQGQNISLFAVFDGHGGFEVSKFAERHFVETLISNPNFASKDYKKALEESFLKIDELMLQPKGQQEIAQIRQEKTQGEEGESMAGCTANVVLIAQNKIYVANAGDSRSVLCRGNEGQISEKLWSYLLTINRKMMSSQPESRKLEGKSLWGESMGI